MKRSDDVTVTRAILGLIHFQDTRPLLSESSPSSPMETVETLVFVFPEGGGVISQYMFCTVLVNAGETSHR